MTPKLRFKGFSDKWEENKLGDLMNSFSYGLNASAKPYDGENKYLRITDIDEDNRSFKKDKLTSPDINLYDKESYLLNKGDIVFARTGASTGKAYMYNNDDGKVYYAGFLIRAKTNEKIASSFLFNYTFTTKYKHFIIVNSMRSGQPGINSNELKKINIFLPQSKEEQKQIGSFFNKIDNLIKSKAKKIAKLEFIKKEYSQKLFVDINENEPKIRFANFNDNWNEFEFGKVIVKNKVKNKDDNYSLVESVSNTNGFIKQDEQFKDRKVASSNLKNYYVITENTFAYNPSRINVGSIAYKKTGEETSLVSPLYVSFKTNDVINDGFVWYWIKSEMFKKQRNTFSEGGVRDTLSFEQLSNFQIKIPSIKEQQKIVALFNGLTKQINLQQKKLDRLNVLKHGYLQKIFD